MKRVGLISFISFLCLFCAAQTGCPKVYGEALQEYKKGNYTEAQRKFVIVAQTCGDYSEVWNKLKDCNAKLKVQQQQQAQQITALTNENSTLAQQKKEAELERDAANKEIAVEAGMIKGLKNTINDLNAEIQNRDSTILHLWDSIRKLQVMNSAKKPQIEEKAVFPIEHQDNSNTSTKNGVAQQQESTEESQSVLENSATDLNDTSESLGESKGEKVCNCNCWICKLEIKHQKNKKQKKAQEQEQQNNKEND